MTYRTLILYLLLFADLLEEELVVDLIKQLGQELFFLESQLILDKLYALY